ncbi:MAG: hypothetical protein DRN30_01110 [Thermoplasmata archaeon]|nr:MAG: hypothetical protein DRN30_01110 [Thermoplasmata archaeon]
MLLSASDELTAIILLILYFITRLEHLHKKINKLTNRVDKLCSTQESTQKEVEKLKQTYRLFNQIRSTKGA